MDTPQTKRETTPEVSAFSRAVLCSPFKLFSRLFSEVPSKFKGTTQGSSKQLSSEEHLPTVQLVFGMFSAVPSKFKGAA